jgi:hypothetical protein
MCGVQDDDQLFMEMLHIPLTQRTYITLILSSPVDLVKYVGDYRSLTVRCHWMMAGEGTRPLCICSAGGWCDSLRCTQERDHGLCQKRGFLNLDQIGVCYASCFPIESRKSI